MNKISELDLAYLAGLFDGEGCINMSKQPKRRFNQDAISYQPRIVIVNSNEMIIRWVHSIVGEGSVYLANKKARNPKWKPIYRWVLTTRKSIEFLKLILPYLKIKSEQAKILINIQFCNHGEFFTEEQINNRLLAYENIKKLNQRGCSLLPIVD